MQHDAGREYIANLLSQKDFWTVREIAELLSNYLHKSISLIRVYRLIYKNKLKTVRMHRNYYIHKDEFMKVFDSYSGKAKNQ